MITPIKTYQILIKHLKREEKKMKKHLLNSLPYKPSRARTVTIKRNKLWPKRLILALSSNVLYFFFIQTTGSFTLSFKTISVSLKERGKPSKNLQNLK